VRFMVIVKATKDTEAGVLPDEKLLTEMGKYNAELIKAGVLLAAEGLQPSSKGARIRFSGNERTVIDGPFTDFHGKVTEINAEKGKLKVLVNMFGRETPVELDLLQVERLR